MTAPGFRPPRFGNVLFVRWSRKTAQEARDTQVSIGWGLVVIVLAALGYYHEAIREILYSLHR